VGGGVLVMPALSYDYKPGDGSERHFVAGTVIRVPGVLEWEFGVSDHLSIVPGIIPSVLVLKHGEQAKNRAHILCAIPEDCEPEHLSVGLAIEGAIGVMLWINRQALRADLRFGFETLETVSVADNTSVGETLTGPRMTVLLGFEI
jgi:hypothetical protein